MTYANNRPIDRSLFPGPEAQLATFLRQPAGRRLVVVSQERMTAHIKAAARAAGVRLALIDAAVGDTNALLERIDRCIARKAEVLLIENFDAGQGAPRFDWQVRAHTQEHRMVGYLFAIKPSGAAWLTRPHAAFHKQLSFVEFPGPSRAS